MRIINGEKGTPGADALPLLAGAAAAVAGVGATLALTGIDSPLRAPFTLFHLFATPAAALHAWLPGLEWTGRLTVSVAGSLMVDLLAAHALSASGSRSARNYVLIISVSALIVYLSAQLPKGRNAPKNRKRQFRSRM
ncbi:hypothetical protein ACFWFI_30100 [Streptomyces sp. NPDC060209]|uniref:hypothetical protein n=1 Tax=Streptomyces sp. NPDC060209 TaxID=3347073 RepID=UPI003651E6C8